MPGIAVFVAMRSSNMPKILSIFQSIAKLSLFTSIFVATACTFTWGMGNLYLLQQILVLFHEWSEVEARGLVQVHHSRKTETINTLCELDFSSDRQTGDS